MELAQQLSSQRTVLAAFSRANWLRRPETSFADVDPTTIAKQILSTTRTVDEMWDAVGAEIRAGAISNALAALWMIEARRNAGLGFHLIAPLLSYKAYRITLNLAKIEPQLIDFARRRASESDFHMLGARLQVGQAFIDRAKEVLKSYRSGNFKRYTTEELLDKARRARESRNA